LRFDEQVRAVRNMPMLTAWLPYGLVALLLVATRLKQLPYSELLQDFAVRVESIFGTPISHEVKPLYLPGAVFLVVSLITFFLHRMDLASCGRSLRRSAKTLVAASAALVFTVPMVQVFIHSKGPIPDQPDMPIALATGVEALVGGAWPVFATFIGGIGAAVAGSNTISNMMFSSFQFEVGRQIGVDPTWVVALQAVGGAAGNTICVHNVVAASAVVGLVGKEGSVIRKTLIAFAYYALLTGALGYSIVWWPIKGPANIGTLTVVLILALVVCLLATNRGRPEQPESPTSRNL
jgi:lactate permease